MAPESAALDEVVREVGVGAQTLQCWRSDALSQPVRDWSRTAVHVSTATRFADRLGQGQKIACR